MKIVITNTVALNAGDAAILLGVVNTVREAFGPGTEIIVLDKNAEAAKKYYPTLRFEQLYGEPRRVSRRLLDRIKGSSDRNKRIMQSADMVISTGGTYLVEHYPLRTRIGQLAFAVESGTPVVMFTQSLGPFKDPYNVKALRKLFPKLPLILLRDEKSRAHIEEIGIDSSSTAVVADAAFMLADPNKLDGRRMSSGPLKVAMSVRDWKFPGAASRDELAQRYMAAVNAAVARLVSSHGAEVTFLSTCQGVEEYWTDDSRTAAAFAHHLPDGIRASVDSAFHSPSELIELLADYDFVISTRLHFAILALCAGTPVLPIAYEFKTKELFSALRMGEWTQDIERITPEAMPLLIDRFLERLPDLYPIVADGVLRQRQSAASAVSLLREVSRRSRRSSSDSPHA